MERPAFARCASYGLADRRQPNDREPNTHSDRLTTALTGSLVIRVAFMIVRRKLTATKIVAFGMLAGVAFGALLVFTPLVSHLLHLFGVTDRPDCG